MVKVCITYEISCPHKWQLKILTNHLSHNSFHWLESLEVEVVSMEVEQAAGLRLIDCPPGPARCCLLRMKIAGTWRGKTEGRWYNITRIYSIWISRWNQRMICPYFAGGKSWSSFDQNIRTYKPRVCMMAYCMLCVDTRVSVGDEDRNTTWTLHWEQHLFRSFNDQTVEMISTCRYVVKNGLIPVSRHPLLTMGIRSTT